MKKFRGNQKKTQKKGNSLEQNINKNKKQKRRKVSEELKA